MSNAIGTLETKGLLALVKGVDAMLKVASVKLVGSYKDMGSSYMSAQVMGDVASVKAAIEAGAMAAREVGVVASALVIANPSEELLASTTPAKK